MPYWTQGVVAIHAPPTRISISPTADYEVTHDKIFIRKEDNDSRIFLNGYIFYIDDILKPLLIQAAINNVCLRVGINDGNEVVEVRIPVKSERS